MAAWGRVSWIHSPSLPAWSRIRQGAVPQPARRVVVCCLAAGFVGLLLATGCATPPLNSARASYYAGRPDLADASLTSLPGDGKDTVLYLLERGMIRQARRQYESSSRDWLEAVRIERDLETHSVSKGGASMVVNDSVLSFRGYPYERTLLHTFLAKNYLARGMWDDAAVEARNIIRRLEDRNGYPDDAYSRYMAGFCLQMINDDSNAGLQFRTASELLTDVKIDENTGRFVPATVPAAGVPPPVPAGTCELVCFVGIGRQADWVVSPDAHAEIRCQGSTLGRTHTLATTAQLTAASERRMAAQRIAKGVARVALKESIAEVVAHENEGLGDLVRVLLFSLEQPDDRRWETLPLILAVARVPCPTDLKSFEVVFHNAYASPGYTITVTQPIVRRGNVYYSFCRDIPFAEPPAGTNPAGDPALPQ
jgi:hypothetical protein